MSILRPGRRKDRVPDSEYLDFILIQELQSEFKTGRGESVLDARSVAL